MMLKSKSLRLREFFAPTLSLGLSALGSVTLAWPAQAAMIPVLTNSDIVADDGACSLREAIEAANTDTASGASPGECPAGSGRDTITVPAMVITLQGRLEIESPMDVIGSGAGSTVVDGDGRDKVFLVSANASLRALTIRGGTVLPGAGVAVSAGTVEIANARITDNGAPFGAGGGLFVASGATVTVRSTTIDDNEGAGAGGGGAGGIANQGTLFVHESLIANNRSNRTGGVWNSPSAILNLRNTTLSGNEGNSPDAGTGGLSNQGFAFLNNVTITGNLGRGNNPASFLGGGLRSGAAATTVVKNSIIANNDGRGGPNDCFGPLTSDSRYNLIEDTVGCGLPAATGTFVLGQDPQLGPLTDNGGPTDTHLPASTSPAVDAGFPFPPGGPAADACEATDQRGVPRLLCDMGAVEREVPVPTELAVTTTVDQVDETPGDGTCATVSGTCSLRAAVQEANRLPGSQTITVPPGSYAFSIPPGDEGGFDPAAGGDLDLLDDVIVAGAGRGAVFVDGNDLSRIFDVGPGVAATIRRMTIRDGTDSGGGGVRVSSGSLTLDDVIVDDNESTFDGGGIAVGGLESVLHILDSIVRDNRAPFFGGDGGGIAGNGDITVERTRIVRNEASGAGGGLRGSGTVSVIESTIARNEASGGILANGGGISALGLNLVKSTVSGNSADAQGGGVFGSGAIVNSTISGNTSETSGGGVSTSGTLSLLHVTIAANQAEAGGNGLHRFGLSSELSFQNTILANPGGTECAGLPPSSLGNNIVSDRSCGPRRAGDLPATDAHLGPLADYGGPTETHILTNPNPARGKAADVGLLEDQRGRSRPRGSGPDIGSVER